MGLEQEKKMAAIKSVALVKNGMLVGLGSGSTAAFMILKLGEEVAKGLSIKGVPSSDATAKLAREVGIPLISLEEAMKLDINIDGADEFDSSMQLIKGGGGALLREKIVAYNSKYNVIIADSTKEVRRLGKFKLPIETIPFATKNIIGELTEMGLKPKLRLVKGSPYKTDEENLIVDLDIFEWDDIPNLNEMLIRIPGIVETGLFLDSTDLILVGKGDSVIKIEK
ncbi:ribose-5-phosphate isomerase RpiA [Kriegella aquimaris]|uniref:Ribose-5-phosphate isomerase A n=1 Tax=Kriegella aquimaris TaxID=192904 RepID=A0A1G9S1X5_9FLAO|nr:ribose-5-phosphate isomerase RpiA [Kriegella aquimaris]SDM29481.1 ribose-5-phosphate isomerase [Kriegella aquimaris]